MFREASSCPQPQPKAHAMTPARTALVETESRATPSRAVQRVVSAGGIEAWLVEEHAVPLVAMEFAFIGGATQDPAAKPGVASMLAGLLDEGAGPHTSDAFQELLAARAIELDFRADHDTLRGSLKTLLAHADTAFDLTRLAVTQARLDADAIERVRAQMLAGLRHEAKNPASQAGLAFLAAAFPDHPYGRPVRGTLDSVAAIDRKDLDAYRLTVLTRGNLFVSVVGAIDAATLAGQLDAIFGALPAEASLMPVAAVAPQGLGSRTIVPLDVPQSVVRFGCAGIARRDADYLPAYVVNHILGGGVFSARLFKEVREKRGLAYGISTSLLPMRHAALLMGGTATKNERVAESIGVIGDEIRRLAAEGPTAEELKLAKQYIVGSYALNFDTSTKIAAQLLTIAIEGLGIDYIDRRNSLIEAITADDIARAGRRLLGDGSLLVVVAGQPVGV